MAERRKDQRDLLRLVIGVLVVSVVVGVAVGVASYIQISHINRNTNAIRRAGYETCARGNGVRAELQFRAGLTPPRVAVQLIKQLGLPSSLAKQTSADAVRRRLPIYDCAPLLKNEAAHILTPAAQQRFVEAFARGDKPVPPP